MSLTWQGSSSTVLPPLYDQVHIENPDPAIEYRVRRTTAGVDFRVHLPGRDLVNYGVEEMVGGTRHGVSFLMRIHDIEGVPLTRAPLVEGRYLYSRPLTKLAMSPGFPLEKPVGFETGLGRVLSPGFERKCLSCHGQPRQIGPHTEIGVTCESCHGPGQPHLLALGKKTADKGILNPKRLPIAERMRPCSQCHSGFNPIQDPMPDDLLISNQVTALQNSECWRQTKGQLTCANCHNPHQDAPTEVLQARSEKTCLSCHGVEVSAHASVCPVKQTSGCVGCHMPEVKDRPPFLITDHWIRVHPEPNVARPKQLPEWRNQRAPERMFLRMVVVDDEAKAADLKRQLADGASFFDLARANSLDKASALNGGFLGDMAVEQLDPAWSSVAAHLLPSEISDVIHAGGKCVILQRMPRGFRENAEVHFSKAMEARSAGDRQKASAELLEALRIYPRFLRALTNLGVIYGEAGNPQTGAGILSVAARLYPEDAGAHFNLGIAYGAMGNDEEISEYKKALEIDPDLGPAYLNLGAALYNKGKYDEAVKVYRQGLQINPLIASLHYSLGIALQHEGKKQEAEKEMSLATKIDPKTADR